MGDVLKAGLVNNTRNRGAFMTREVNVDEASDVC